MKVLEVREPFGIEALAFAERPDPSPGPGEVLVRVQAIALNYRDLMVVDGVGRWRAASPRVPVSDAVGAVVATGRDVTRVAVGERVAPVFYPAWIDGEIAAGKTDRSPGGAMADGYAAEYAVVREEGLVRVPAHLSDEEAATLPTAGVTAWNAVVVHGGVRPGGTVVTLGTGGVSLFVLQLARALGARAIVTSSDDAKLARAVELGAAVGINYRTRPDWPSAVLEATGGNGADLVVDTVGDLGAAITAARLGGAIVFVGFLGGMSAQVDLARLMSKAATIRAIDVGSRAMFEDMDRALELHRIHPVVDRVFPFTDAHAAFRHLKEARHFGKVALRL